MATPAAPLPATVREHVVLVDHELDTLKALVAPLRGQFEFHLTISASDALSLLEQHPVAVLVTGQKLFSTSGMELLSEARKRSPRTVRILLADASERRSVDATQLEGTGIQVLMKPCTSQQLREVLQVGAWSSNVAVEETGEVEHVVMETAGSPAAQTDVMGAPVTVLTTDANLYEAIRTAVQGRHETHLATRLEDATELAATGRCPVLVTDMALAQPALERIARHLGTHEPALVTVVVGSREQGNALMGLLGSGVIHRFLLKPVTPGLARLAIDSAARHHQGLLTAPRPPPVTRPRAAAARGQPRAVPPAPAPAPASAAAPRAVDPRDQATFELTAPLSVQAEQIEADDEPPERSAKPGARLIAGGASVLALIAVAAGWWWYQSSQGPALDPVAQTITRHLTAALAAYEAGRLLEPPGDSALHHYREILRLDDQNAAALAGMARLAEEFIQQTETMLVQGRLDEAAVALEHLRTVSPQHRRLLFLDTQLRKEQQDRLVLQARESVSAGDTRKAQELLEQAAQMAPQQSGELDAAQQAVRARERAQFVGQEIDLARQALAQGRLVTPVNDSAEFHFRAAQQADPASLAAQQGLRDLGERVIAEVGQTIERGQFDTARILIRKAQDLGAPPEQITALRANLEAGELQQANRDLADLVVRRSEENRLLEPAQDSARHYLDRLRAADPQHPALPQATRALGARLVANAQLAIGQRQFDLASRLLGEARAIGFQAPELAAADNALRLARPAPASTSGAGTAAVNSAGSADPLTQVAPQRLRAAVPEYPRRALEQGEQGWVDVSFRVAADGTVADARVEAASPRNTFERAALSAVRQWRFETRTAQTAYTQRLRTRVEFKLEGE